MKLRFYFHQLPYADKTEVYLIGEAADGKRFLAKNVNLIFEPIAEGSLFPAPTFEFSGNMSREFFPALTTALAESGYRAASQDAGELAATKYHLEDMRKLVLK